MAGVVVAYAQQVTLDIQPRTLRITESATLKLTFLNLNPPQAPTLPEIPGFDLQYVGQEQQFNIINGSQERRLTYNYRLQPLSTGQFRLGPFSMSISGQNIDFEPMMIEVLPASGSSPGGESETMDDLVFAKVILPRQEVYLQERFDVEVSLYHRGINLHRDIQFQNLPSTGLNLEDIQEIGSTRETVGSELYEVRRFRMRGTALTSGTFVLAPMVRVHVLVRRERSRDPFFSFFGGTHEAQPLVVPAEPMNVVIRPLPSEGRPQTFGGAVGKFNMEMDVQPQEISAGDPITLSLRITGRGNFETISMPSINLGDEFRRYDPKLIASGRDHKIFEQVFIPRNDRIRELPPVSFSFFDPEEGKYQTIVRGPFPLVVKAGSSDAPHVVQAPSSAPALDRAPLGIDIVDLKRNPARWEITDIQRHTSVDVAVHAVPALALAALFFVQRRRQSIHQDITRRRRSLAPRSARTAIQSAEKALSCSDITVFYESLWQAMADYVAHRCNLEAGEVSPNLILSKLKAGGLDSAQLEELTRLLHTCEEVRFAPAGYSEPAEELRKRLQITQDILRACERIRI